MLYSVNIHKGTYAYLCWLRGPVHALIEASLCLVIASFVEPDFLLGQKVDCAHGATEARARKDKRGMYEQDTGGQGKRKEKSILLLLITKIILKSPGM